MISGGVFYRKYGDQVYIRDVRKQKDYLLNETAGYILDYFQYHDSEDGLLPVLQTIYDTQDIPEFEKDISDFLVMLRKTGILVDGFEQEYMPNLDEPVSERIREQCMEQHRLFSVSLELTYRCSEKCIHCYVDDAGQFPVRDELTLEDYKSVLDQLREMGCMQILLTGGEVCLREDLSDIAEYAVEKGFVVDIYTNGISMTDEQFDRLIALPLNSISFSLYGGTASVHDHISRVPGSFEKTLQRMMMVKCAGIETYIKTVVMKENADDYENLLKLGKRLKISIASSLMITPTHMGTSVDVYRLNDIDAYTRILDMEFRYNPPNQAIGERDLGSPVCGCGQYILSINPSGDVFPCVAMPVKLGNVKKDRLSDIWKNNSSLRKIQDMCFFTLSENCAVCKSRNYCSVCMGNAYMENHGLIAPTKESCMLAEANRQSTIVNLSNKR